MENSMVISAIAQRPDTGLSSMSSPDEETLIRHKEIISSICGRLTHTVQQQKPIQDGELFDFSKIVIWVIRDSMLSLPNVLDGLYGSISDYWHFEANSDTNFKRKHSYIRLYQMLALLQNFAVEQEQNQKALSVLEKNIQNMGIISFLHSYPGITHRKLREILDLSSEELQVQLDSLKKGGFLTNRRSGEEQYYMLTNAGEALYGQLHLQERKKQTACERRELFANILQILLYYGTNSYQIILVFERLQNCENAELEQLLQLLRQCYDKWLTVTRTKHDETASRWISALSSKNINLPHQHFSYFQPYQRRVVKKNLLSSKEYQGFQIYLNKTADTHM